MHTSNTNSEHNFTIGYISILRRVLLMSVIVLFSLLTVTLTILITPIMLLIHALSLSSAKRYTDKPYAHADERFSPRIIEGQYKVID